MAKINVTPASVAEPKTDAVEQTTLANISIPAEAWAVMQQQQKQIDELKTLIIEKLTVLATQPQQQHTPQQTAVEKMLLDQMLKKKADDEKFESEKKYISFPCDIRSQVNANRAYKDGDKLFKIGVGWSPDVIIRGQDRIHCQGRYNELCGILGVKKDEKHPDWTTYRIADVTNDPEARRLANITRDGLIENGDPRTQAA
jgi:hypothetical protein